MWTLIVITLLATTGPNGGASTTTTLVEFADQQKCTTAANALNVPDFAHFPAQGTAASGGGLYRIVARCLAR
jgi:hypothetical protein